MQEFEFLKPLVMIFGVSAIVVFILGKLKIPSIVGFLFAGVILGPHGFQLIKNVHEVEQLAEIGVILLMFTIGLEFSLKNLMMLRAAILGGGFLQSGLTAGVVVLLSYFFFGQELNKSVFYGFLIAMSSTAIVIKLLMDRAELNTPHGRTSVGILIFQDLCVVPFMLFTPILAGEGGGFSAVVLTMLKACVVVGGVLFLARWGVPHILHNVVKTKSRELFIITIMLLCISTAYLTYKLGLSLALGAFLAGIVMSDSEYATQAISDILPFKESFIGLFFISVGMLMNIGFMRDNLFTVAAVVLVVLVLKAVAANAASYAIGLSLRHSIQTGTYLSQVGEFSFILALAGKAYGLITEDIYQIFLSSSVITMILTPFIISASPTFSGWLTSKTVLKRLDRMHRKAGSQPSTKKKDHVIVVGFGVNGRNIARVLRESGIPYTILELNANTVKKMKKQGEPIYYGDGTSLELLHKLGINSAKILVIAISDAASTRMIVQLARKENPDIYIIVRTRYVAEVEDLVNFGANEVIPEEFETSIEIFSRVLHRYHIPKNVITGYIDNVRKDSYSILRTVELPKKHLDEHFEFLKDIETETFLIKEDFHVGGHSIKELHLRAETGVTIIAVQREDRIFQNPSPDFVLNSGDVILLIGKRKDINHAMEYLESDRFLVARYHR